MKKFTYLMTDGALYKIGQSVNPEQRLKQIKTGNPFCELICFGDKVSEQQLHVYFFKRRISGEWFSLEAKQIEEIKNLLANGFSYEAEVGNPDDIKYKTVIYKGVEVRTNKRINNGAKFYKLSTEQKLRNIAGKKRSEDLSSKYVISFGKYKGTKIVDMKSDEQINYIIWLVDEMKKSYSKNSKKKCRKYKAFNWWLRNYNK